MDSVVLREVGGSSPSYLGTTLLPPMSPVYITRWIEIHSNLLYPQEPLYDLREVSYIL